MSAIKHDFKEARNCMIWAESAEFFVQALRFVTDELGFEAVNDYKVSQTGNGNDKETQFFQLLRHPKGNVDVQATYALINAFRNKASRGNVSSIWLG